VPFDGRNWAQPRPVYPRHYHPETVVTDETPASVLTNAFVAARNNERRIFESVYPYSLKNPAATAATPDHFISAAPIVVGEGYRQIPLLATHAVADITYSIGGESGYHTAVHRIGYVSSGDSDTSADVVTTVTDRDVSDPGMLRAWRSQFDPYASDPDRQHIRISIALKAGTTGLVNRVFVDAHAFRVAGALSLPQPYRPISVTCWWESVD